MGFIVATERLGVPGAESSWLERKGYVQKSLQYPTDPEKPSATCHLQPDEDQDALCGYEWECLVAVPDATSFADVPEELWCTKCRQAAHNTAN
jgi:hypothetical protein